MPETASPPGSAVVDAVPRWTLDQQRAKHALACVQCVANDPGAGHKTNYRSYVRALPLLLTMNGLGQTIALELAGASRSGDIGKGHEALLGHILLWLTGREDGWSTSPYRSVRFQTGQDVSQKGQALIEAITDEDERAMLRAQVELMAYLKWLKTFAEALIAPPEKGEA